MTFLGKKCNFEIMITVYFQLALCGGEKKTRTPKKLDKNWSISEGVNKLTKNGKHFKLKGENLNRFGVVQCRCHG